MSESQLTPGDPTPSRSQELLLEFLREHDADCPLCGYNLKTLTRPICPECGQELLLTVGTKPLRLGWLMTSVAPGFFSGICAFFVFVVICIHLVMLGSTWPVLVILDSFGWASLIFAIYLSRKRHKFLAMPVVRQRWWAVGIWLVHIAAFFAFAIIGPRYAQ